MKMAITGDEAKVILEDILAGLESKDDSGLGLSHYERALLQRLKRFTLARTVQYVHAAK